ncbi:2-amino-4-hydroxy-6-hydroxymethyldihydropteridine diphosphokinase [Actinomyces gaoshouyii]|uniref:2-amino-4-hydroxy-6- hydroxymethyldihydropteridine diphosphokinase n=1 Tax=Actinomyces gaoshouyii TaxID=1960083 RepID=UPI0009BC923A|nr:2-amino-4-hydroxy-6-hydroxymethyldihydropteridine diphosphokinase [Actinomyces gaoshouyii]ARD41227.1 hypothetical protein B6G06_01570 [Actinomyces gaoshouyii]
MSTVTSFSSDRIRLTGLSARGYHGVLPFERSEGQIFTADIALDLGPRGTAVAAVTDSLNDALDYSAVANAVVALIEGEPVALLETLAERISETVLAFPRVMAVEVTIHKPNAPLEVAFDDVSVTITRLSEAAASVLSSATSAPAAASAPVVASAPSAAPCAAAADASEPPLPRASLPLPSAPSVPSAPAGAPAAEPINDAPPYPGALTGRLDAVDDSRTGVPEAPLAQGSSAPEPAQPPVPPVGDLGEGTVDHFGQAGPLRAGSVDEAWAAVPFSTAEPVGGDPGEDSHENRAEGAGFDGVAPAYDAGAHDPGATTPIDDAASHATPAPLGMGSPARPGDDRIASPAPAASGEDTDSPIGAGSSAVSQYQDVEPGHAVVAEAAPLPAGPAVDPLAEAPTAPVPVVIGLGGNLGEVVPSLRRAVRTLQSTEGVEVTAIAPLARTAAVIEPGAGEQPDYLNTVILARTSLSAKDVLALCRRLEADAGRVRLEPKGPRTLDADVITYSDLRSADPELILPHPRATSRSFVLLPWSQADAFAEIDGQSVAALAEQAPDRDGIRWLALDWIDSDALPKLPTGQYVPADALADSSQKVGAGERASQPQDVPDFLSAPSAALVGDEEEPFSETVPASMIKDALAQDPSSADAAPPGPGMPGAPSAPVPPAPPAPSPFVDQAPQVAEPISGAAPGQPGRPGQAPQDGRRAAGPQRSDDHTWSASSGWEDVIGRGGQGN